MNPIILNTLDFEIPASNPKRFIKYNILVKEFDEKVKSGKLTIGDIKGTYILTLKNIVSFMERDYSNTFIIVDDEVVNSFCDFTRKIVYEYLKKIRKGGINKKFLFRLKYITECIYFLIPYNKFIEGNYLSDLKKGEDGLMKLGRSLGIVPELLDEGKWRISYGDNYVDNKHNSYINSNRRDIRKSKSSWSMSNMRILALDPPTSRSNKLRFDKNLKEKALNIYRGFIRDRLSVYDIRDDISLLHGISQSMRRLRMSSPSDKLVLEEEMYERVINTYKQYFSGETSYNTSCSLKTDLLYQSIYLISLISDLKYEDFEFIINSTNYNWELRECSGTVFIGVDGLESLISEYSRRNGISKSIEKFLMRFNFKDKRKNKVDSIRLYIPNIDTELVDMTEDILDGKGLRGSIKLSDFSKLKSKEGTHLTYIGTLKRGAFTDKKDCDDKSVGYKLILPKRVEVKLVEFLRLVITRISNVMEDYDPRVLNIVISLDNHDNLLHRLEDLLWFFRFFMVDITEVFYKFTIELEPKLKEFNLTEYLTGESYLKFFTE